MNNTLSYQLTTGVILAAGCSARFGTPKQLLKLNNRPMVEWVLDNALKSRLQRIVLVLGCQYQNILKLLGKKTHHPRLKIVVNHSFEEGLRFIFLIIFFLLLNHLHEICLQFYQEV